MAIGDVFRNISERIHIFQSSNWNSVPDRAGVYAWFYPIKVTSENLDSFLDELRTVRNYDALHKGFPATKAELPFAWTNMNIEASMEPRVSSFPTSAREQWDEILRDKNAFTELRKTLLVSSLLMPPLYVGKTTSLMRRCSEHRGVFSSQNEEERGNNFCTRFEKFADEHDVIRTKSVGDLIMACVFTTEARDFQSEDMPSDDRHSLVEEILKTAGRPAYGLR